MKDKICTVAKVPFWIFLSISVLLVYLGVMIKDPAEDVLANFRRGYPTMTDAQIVGMINRVAETMKKIGLWLIVPAMITGTVWKTTEWSSK